MTMAELEKLSLSLTYKGRRCFRIEHRSWRNAWAPCPDGYVYFSIWMHAFDVDNGSETKIEVGSLSAIKDLEQCNESSHISHIRDSLILLEMHEVNETIALDGKRIFDPHNLDIRRIPVQPELKAA